MSNIGLNSKRDPDRKLASQRDRYSRKTKRAERELNIEAVLADLKNDFNSKLANAGRQGI